MSNYDLRVDFETLDNINKRVDEYGNQLIAVLDKCKSLMDDLKIYYNTPNSKVIINVIEEYLLNKQTYVKEYYLPVNERVKMITNEYTSLHNDVRDTVK